MMSDHDPYAGRSRDPRGYFDDVADLYDRHRPNYPTAAIEAILDEFTRTPTVADIGCGTGILARQLAGRGARVIGIDPSEAMLNVARAAPPPRGEAITYHHGSAEETGLDDGSVDVVTCGQAFHWFDPSRALPELARILAPGGRLALLWNLPNEADPASTAYNRIIERARQAAEQSGRTLRRHHSNDPTEGGWFSDVRRRHFDNPQTYDADSLLARAQSASFYPTAGPLRDELDGELRELFKRFEDNDGTGRMTMTLQTLVVIATRSESEMQAGRSARR